MSSLLSTFVATCQRDGLDVVHPFSTAWCDDRLTSDSRLPDFGRRNALGILVGNTRALWPIFKGALAAEPPLRGAAHPLDDYITSRLHSAVPSLRTRSAILWAHVTEPEPLPIQRIAEAAGLARIAPSHLNIHPIFGPWFALRALVVVDAEGPLGPPPSAPDRCSGCSRPCMPALALAIQRSGGTATGETVRASWAPWVDVRDACPEGRAHRYASDQIEYHYTKNRAMLAPRDGEP